MSRQQGRVRCMNPLTATSASGAQLAESLAAALQALRDGRPLRAEELCRDYLGLRPGCAEHLRLLAHALIKQQRFAEAEHTLRDALALEPDMPRLHEDLGSVMALQQRFEEAVGCFEQAIRIEPRLPLHLAAS
jgi:Flp pilus assembly protein TadD